MKRRIHACHMRRRYIDMYIYINIYIYIYGFHAQRPLVRAIPASSSNMRRRIHAGHMRRRIHACHMRRRIHACHMSLCLSLSLACHMRRRIHACHMRRRIHACHIRTCPAHIGHCRQSAAVLPAAACLPVSNTLATH
jgi:hypothetical protein